MEVVAIKGDLRDPARKKGAKAVRREGKVPCVLYGASDNMHFATMPLNLRPVIYTPEFKIVELDIDGAKTRCILKDVQFHPVTDEVVHVDFLELTDGKPVKVEIPVCFTGIAPGLKAGGAMIQKLRRVALKTIPEKLMNELELDISHLQLGQSVRVSDVNVEEGVEVLNNPNIPIASIEVPRLLKSLEAEEAEAAEAEAEAAAAAEGEEGEGGEEPAAD